MSTDRQGQHPDDPFAAARVRNVVRSVCTPDLQQFRLHLKVPLPFFGFRTGLVRTFEEIAALNIVMVSGSTGIPLIVVLQPKNKGPVTWSFHQ